VPPSIESSKTLLDKLKKKEINQMRRAEINPGMIGYRPVTRHVLFPGCGFRVVFCAQGRAKMTVRGVACFAFVATIILALSCAQAAPTAPLWPAVWSSAFFEVL
jgi:hypothetical protein